MNSKRILWGAIVAIGILFLSVTAATGYLFWTAGKYTVSKVQQLAPENASASIQSTLNEITTGKFLAGCMATVSDIFARDLWLSQPLQVSFAHIQKECWPN